MPSQLRQLLSNESPYPHVLQSNRIDHPGGGLADPWAGVAVDGLGRKSLDHDPAQRTEIHQMGELHPVAKRATRCDYRVFEGDTANADLKVNCSGPLWAACRRRRTHGLESITLPRFQGRSGTGQTALCPRIARLFGIVRVCVR